MSYETLQHMQEVLTHRFNNLAHTKKKQIWSQVGMSSLCSEVGNDEMWRLDRDMSVISGSFLSFDSLGETKQLHILIACLKTTRYYTKYNNKQATYYYTYPPHYQSCWNTPFFCWWHVECSSVVLRLILFFQLIEPWPAATHNGTHTGMIGDGSEMRWLTGEEKERKQAKEA